MSEWLCDASHVLPLLSLQLRPYATWATIAASAYRLPVMSRKKLPIGIQTFARIREDDCYYVDKTGIAL